MTPSVGQQIASWTLIHELGSGGMARVFLARDARGRLAALKVPLNPDLFRRFANEVRLTQRVRSAFTAQVIDARVAAPDPFVAFEYIQGPTLDQQIRLDGGKPDLRLLAIGLAEGLRHIHSAGIVHRDLKPSNVVITAARPVIIDFGIAQDPRDQPMTQAGLVIGTLGWLSPEQERGQVVGPATDIYNWAKLLEWSCAQGLEDSSASAGSCLAPDLQRVVDASLAEDPALRPTAEDLLEALAASDGPTLADHIARDWDVVPVPASPLGSRITTPQPLSGPPPESPHGQGVSSAPASQDVNGGGSGNRGAAGPSDPRDSSTPAVVPGAALGAKHGRRRPRHLRLLGYIVIAVLFSLAGLGASVANGWGPWERPEARDVVGSPPLDDPGLTEAPTDNDAAFEAPTDIGREPVPDRGPPPPMAAPLDDGEGAEEPGEEEVEADEPELPTYTPDLEPEVPAHVRLTASGAGCEGNLCGCPATGSYSLIEIEHGAVHPYEPEITTVSMTWSGNAPIDGQFITFRLADIDRDGLQQAFWTSIGWRQEAFLDVSRQYWVTSNSEIEENLHYVNDRVHVDGRSYYGWGETSSGTEGKQSPRTGYATAHVLCYLQPATSHWETAIPITTVPPEACRYRTYEEVYYECYHDTFEWRDGKAVASDTDWYDWFVHCRFNCERG